MDRIVNSTKKGHLIINNVKGKARGNMKIDVGDKAVT